MSMIPFFIPMNAGCRGGGDFGKVGNIIVISILGLLMLFMIVVLTDEFSHGFFYKLFRVKADKEYVIPDGYRMIHNESTGKYMIMKTGQVCEYMTIPSLFYGEVEWFCMDAGTQFSDSSKAKGALKQYVTKYSFK